MSMFAKSLGTSSLAEAKKLGHLWDVRWDQQLAAAAVGNVAGTTVGPAHAPRAPREDELRAVRDCVAKGDAEARRGFWGDLPVSVQERDAMRESIETRMNILDDLDDPRARNWIYSAEQTLYDQPNAEILTDDRLSEVIRHALLEHERKNLDRLEGRHLDEADTSVIGPTFKSIS
jgi:hypothetical protein